MGKLPITIILAAKNEAINISRCIDSLAPAETIYVLDSASNDSTSEIAASMGAKVVQFKYSGGYPRKRQWAIDNLPIETPWIMLVDADESVPEGLWAEITLAIVNTSFLAYAAKKEFHFMGKKFRFGGFSHSAVLIFRKGTARFEELLSRRINDGVDMEVHERLIVNGPVGRLATPVCHNDFKTLESYISKHASYAIWEAAARHELLTGKSNPSAIKPNLFGNIQERRRMLKTIIMRMPFEPEIWFIYHYIIRLGFMEGSAGLKACLIRSQYIRNVRTHLKHMQDV